MRTTVILASVVLGTLSAGLRADPPPALVIRPGGSGVSATRSDEAAPDRPGFVVIRPQRAGPSAADGPLTIKLIGRPAASKAGPLLPAGGEPVKAADPPPAAGGKGDGTVVLETWDAMFLKGHKVGYFHVVVREYDRDGKTFVYATKSQKMTIARFGQVVEQWAEDATMETPDGTVLTTRMAQGIGRDQALALTGTVTGRTLAVRIEGAGGGTQAVPWPAGVVGIAREATLLRDRKPKAGESFDYLCYEGRLNRVVRLTAAVKGAEEVALVEGQKPRKLVRVEQSMEKVGEFRLPPSTVWCDPDTLEPLKMVSDMPAFGGKLTVLRTTKEVALRPVGKVPDLFDVQSVRLDKEIPDVHGRAGVVYRVTLTGDIDPAKAFARDDRQTVDRVDAAAKAFDLRVVPVRGPAKENPGPADPGKEYRSDSFFIDWDNDLVRQRAREAVAGLPADAGAWDKARAVETWVHRNMRATEFSQAMATCANVAKTLSGDCTEYAMLAAGMCRAAGVPSRTALGLVYAPGRDGRPFLAYHMWFEVYSGGHWVGLDATLGRGSVGPGHVKITDASWHEEKSFAPLLPVLSVLGSSPKFEVLRVIDR